MNYYKATRPDGTDFHTGTIDYARALETGEVIRHPAKMIRDDPRTYLSVSVHPANCTGMGWPCRLFRVEPVGRTLKAQFSESKRSCSALRVVEELPAHMALGPQGEEVVALIERCRSLTIEEGRRLDAARDAARNAARAAAWDAAWDAAWAAAWDAARAAARDAAWDAAWDAARDAARDAAWDAARDAAWDAACDAAWDAARDAAWDAARDAALALLTRDLISTEHFDLLYGPWREALS